MNFAKLPLILVGGSARMGKTTLSKKLIRKYSLFGLSVDCITDAMRRSRFVDNASLFVDKNSWGDPDKFINNMRKRDEVAWEFTRHYIMNSGYKGNPLLVEGMLWPDFVEKDKCLFEIEGFDIYELFLVDTSDEKRALNSLKEMSEDPYDWINKYEEEEMRNYVKVNLARSKFIKDMAEKYGMKVYDLADYKDKDECQNVIMSDTDTKFSI